MTSSHVDPPRPRAPPGSAPHFRLSPRSAHAPTLSLAPPPSPPPHPTPAHAPPPADPPRPRHAPGEGKGGGWERSERPGVGACAVRPRHYRDREAGGEGLGGKNRDRRRRRRLTPHPRSAQRPQTEAAPGSAPPLSTGHAPAPPYPARHWLGPRDTRPAPFPRARGRDHCGAGKGGREGGRHVVHPPPPAPMKGGRGLTGFPGPCKGGRGGVTQGSRGRRAPREVFWGFFFFNGLCPVQPRNAAAPPLPFPPLPP